MSVQWPVCPEPLAHLLAHPSSLVPSQKAGHEGRVQKPRPVVLRAFRTGAELGRLAEAVCASLHRCVNDLFHLVLAETSAATFACERAYLTHAR